VQIDVYFSWRHFVPRIPRQNKQFSQEGIKASLTATHYCSPPLQHANVWLQFTPRQVQCVFYPFLLQSSNFTPPVKEARNQSEFFNRKSISSNTTRRQSYHLQAMLTGVKRRKANTSSEKVNNLKTAMKKLRRPNCDK